MAHTPWDYGSSFDAILAQHAEERQVTYERAQAPDPTDLMARVKSQQEAASMRVQREMNKDTRPTFFGVPVALAKPKNDGVDMFLARNKEESGGLSSLWSGKKENPHAGTVWGSGASNGNSFWGGSAGSFWGNKSNDSGGGWGW